MKKLIFAMFALALTATTFVSCEDVPAPYVTPTDSGDDDDPTIGQEAKGTGTLADPYNSVAANRACAALGTGNTSTSDVYIKGVIREIKESYTSTYGNATFYIADNSTDSTFYVYRAYYLGNKKFTDSDKQIEVGDTVVICGKITNYSGTYETAQNSAYLYSLNGKTGSGDPVTPSGDQPTGEGTQASPYNYLAALNAASTLEQGQTTSDTYYIKGKISQIKYTFSAQYGTATYYITDNGSTNDNQFYIYGCRYFNNQKWADGNTQINVGDDVVVCAKLTNYNGVLETSGAYLISLNGKTGDGGGETGGDGGTVTSDDIVNGKTGSVSLDTNKYGTQSTTDESTWYSWTAGGTSYKGVKICISEGTNGTGIQMQGNASDAAKQGFLFNSTAFSKEISKITFKFTTLPTSKYDPSYTVYAGSEAHPTATAVTRTSTTNESGEKYKTYTETYDLSSYNCKYFTLSNNTVGALYISSIEVTLK